MSESRFRAKNKTKRPKLYRYWLTYFILSTIVLVGLFAWSERKIETQQPSENWSIGVSLLENLPDDYRLIDQTKLPDETGVALAYIKSKGIEITGFDWNGKQLKKLLITNNKLQIDKESIMVIKLTQTSDKLYFYYSDRKSLHRAEIEPSSFTVLEDLLISEHAEQFDAIGDIVVSGDNDVTKIYKDDIELASYDNYEDIKRVIIEKDNDTVYAGINAYNKGSLLIYNDNAQEKFKVLEIASDVEMKSYGFFKDIHIEDEKITVVSSKFDHLTPNSPTVMGIWQFDEKTLDEKPFRLFYHVKTDLEPIVTKVEGNQISYILGTQQTTDRVSKGLSRYPQTKGGIFTNVSLFTRDGDALIENTRLTMTRKYPIGYEYLTKPSGENTITWCDKYEKTSTLMMASQGEEWINFANKSFKIGILPLLSSAALAIGNTIFFGVVSWLVSWAPYFKYLVVIGILLYFYYRFAPLTNKKKSAHVLYAMIVMLSVVKLLAIALPTSDYRYFAHIYPWLFGNTVMLVGMSLITTGLSIWMLYLWSKQHYYYENRFMQFSVFFGIDLYLFMLGIMAFFISAMMKNNFML